MVQHLVVPWRDRRELLRVRQQFYPDRAPPVSPPSRRSSDAATQKQQQERQERHHAVARVAMWMHRGNCPHLVESTALLTSAMLGDQLAGTTTTAAATAAAAVGLGDERGGGEGGDEMSVSSSSYAARAAYSAAFSRFVTGLLDSHQDKQRKMSMYAVAKTLGLPAAFVELRHQATHEQLPSAARLRAAARKALDWIWDYYWRHLPDDNEAEAGLQKVGDSEVEREAERERRRKRVCRDLVMRYLELDEDDDDDSASQKTKTKTLVLRNIRRRDEAEVLSVLEEVGDSATDGRLLRGVVTLTRELLARREDRDRSVDAMELEGEGGQRGEEGEGGPLRDVELVREELEKTKQGLQELKRASLSLYPDPDHGRAEGQGGDGEENQPAWSMYEADKWIPKPIGIV